MNAVTLVLAILVAQAPIEKAADVKQEELFVINSALHPKGKGVAMASFEKIVVKDEKNHEVFSMPLPKQSGMVPHVRFSTDGSHLVVESRENVTVYDTKKYRKVFTTEYISNCPPALSPDGKRLALAPILLRGGREIRVYDGQKRTQTLRLDGSESARSTVFSADGKQLLAIVDAISTVNIQLWNVAEEKLLWKTELQGVRNSAVFSPDAQMVVTCTAHGLLTLLNTKDGKVLHEKQVYDFESPNLFILARTLFGDDGSLVVCYDRLHWVPVVRERFGEDLIIRRNFGFERDFDVQFDGCTVQLWEIKDGKATLKKVNDLPVDVTDVKTENDGTVTYVSRGKMASVQTIPQK